MIKHISIIKKAKLFTSLKDEEILSILKCLNARIKKFNKGLTIFYEGDKADYIGLIISGEVEIQKTDYDGNLNIISKLLPADIIAAAACFSSDNRLPFDIVSSSASEILCLDTSSFVSPCCNTCSFHTTVIRNVLKIIADKSLLLTKKIDILTKRTTREKVLEYLHTLSKKAGTKKILVPLTRKQMAEYFSVNRSALSKELASMQNEQIIKYNKNQFEIRQNPSNN